MAKPNNPPGPKAPLASPGAADKSGAGPTGASRAPATAVYLVGATPILRDGQRFEPGATIALSKAQAKRLGLERAPKGAAAETTETNPE